MSFRPSPDTGSRIAVPFNGRSAAVRYGSAMAAVVISLIIRLALQPVFGADGPFSTFVIAVVFASAFGGLGPGLVTTLVSFVAASFFVIEPRYSFAIGDPAHRVRAELFAGIGVIITLVVDRLQRTNQELRRTAAALEHANVQLRVSQEELRQANGRLELSRHDLGVLNNQLRESQGELTQANTELQRSNEELQSFAYSVSHDLRAPIRTIGVFCELLARKYQDKVDKESSELFTHIANGVERMNALVLGLLDYSKVTHSGAPPAYEVDCNEILETALVDCQAAIRETGARVYVDGTLPRVRIDPQRLSQVFTNLITNGLKYRSAVPPEVRISAQDEGNRWLFAVKDNGIGFDMAYAELIFKAFERLDDIPDKQGSGLGLAIVKRVVDRQGGTVWVESKPGNGSTFYFTLPKEVQATRTSSPVAAERFVNQ